MSLKTHDVLIGADFTPSITNDFKFVVGAFGGYSKIKVNFEDRIYIDESKKFSENGWKIGAKLGGIYEINSQNEVELISKEISQNTLILEATSSKLTVLM